MTAFWRSRISSRSLAVSRPFGRELGASVEVPAILRALAPEGDDRVCHGRVPTEHQLGSLFLSHDSHSEPPWGVATLSFRPLGSGTQDARGRRGRLPWRSRRRYCRW
jgi:hypothetical protein